MEGLASAGPFLLFRPLNRAAMSPEPSRYWSGQRSLLASLRFTRRLNALTWVNQQLERPLIHKFSAVLATAALVATPVVAAPPQANVLKRMSKWEMKYDEDACTLAAVFGEGQDDVLMVMTRTSPGDGFELKLFGKPLRYGAIAMPIEVAFGSQPPVRFEGVSATTNTADKTPTVIISGMRLDGWRYPKQHFDPAIKAPVITSEQEAAITTITIRPVGKNAFQLATGAMGGPMKAMRTCTDDLLRHWGFDPAVQASLSRAATPTKDPGNWLLSKDFPANALNKGENGLVRFRLDIEPNGTVSDCRILYRTNPDSFADLSCKLIKERARFTPALDSNGSPVKSFYISQVRWQSGAW